MSMTMPHDELEQRLLKLERLFEEKFDAQGKQLDRIMSALLGKLDGEERGVLAECKLRRVELDHIQRKLQRHEEDIATLKTARRDIVMWVAGVGAVAFVIWEGIKFFFGK
jgi:uncharacterized protein (UPF0335 family)